MAENNDFKRLLGSENLFDEGDDDKECLWLSSNNALPTSFFEEYRLCNSFQFCVDKWLMSWLATLADSYLYLDKASSSLCHENESTVMCLKGGSSSVPENQTALLLESHWNCCEDSRSSSESFASCSSSSSQISDSDRLSFSISLVNLDDAEDNDWISESESECFESGFPSPSWKSSWVGSVLIKSAKRHYHSDQKDLPSVHNDFEASEFEEILETDNDEPLFWPFDLQKIHWNSEETWKMFSMSPRKDPVKLGTPPGSHSKPFGSESRICKMSSKEGCKRRLVFRTGSAASKALELKQRKATNNGAKKSTRNIPSRLRQSNKVLIHDATIQTEGIQKLEPEKLHRELLDDGFLSSEELPIETLLGLGEFDGHEGTDAEFNEEIFIMDDPL